MDNVIFDRSNLKSSANINESYNCMICGNKHPVDKDTPSYMIINDKMNEIYLCKSCYEFVRYIRRLQLNRLI